MARELNLVWGVFSLHSPEPLGNNIEDQGVNAIKQVTKFGKLGKDDHAIVVCGSARFPDSALFVGVYECKDL